MEKYSQFRDRVFASYFLILQWLPIGALGKKASLWSILGIPGIWWIDLQIDGVRRGSLGKQTASRLPQAGSIIASSFTSPIDAIYLAAIFDPVFTISYPSTHKVRQISLLEAVFRAFAKPELWPSSSGSGSGSGSSSKWSSSQLFTIEQLLRRHPNRVIAVFPECTTTNGKGILKLSPSLISAGAGRTIYPVSLRYTPADITTPLPESYLSFLWHLLRKPTHCIRVRIAEQIVIPHAATASGLVEETGGGAGAEEGARSRSGSGRESLTIGRTTGTSEGEELDDLLASLNGSEKTISRCKTVSMSEDFEAALSSAQKELLGQVGESLARLARVRRVGLGAKEKIEFAEMWARKEGRMRRL
ncbi:hypothetical protein KEM54_006419 [Ascosphaera aggregata]|nr:hypothetical protein KEM54_006419 [Ascosphaera aggregata]